MCPNTLWFKDALFLCFERSPNNFAETKDPGKSFELIPVNPWILTNLSDTSQSSPQAYFCFPFLLLFGQFHLFSVDNNPGQPVEQFPVEWVLRAG